MGALTQGLRKGHISYIWLLWAAYLGVDKGGVRLTCGKLPT